MKKITAIAVCVLLLIAVNISALGATYSMTTGYALNNTANTYFRACLGNADPDTDYIIFQNTQYVSMCFIGKFTLTGSQLRCTEGTLITYDSSVSTNDRRYVNSVSGVGHYINITNGVVYYTNIKGIPNNPIPASVGDFQTAKQENNMEKVLYSVLIGILVGLGFNLIGKRWLRVW